MAILSGASVIKLPRWIFFIRIAQAAAALVILALASYGATIYFLDGDGLMLFTTISTLLVITYAVGSEHFFPPAYNFWAILGLECFAVLLWLVSFALLASEVSGFGTWRNLNNICVKNCYLKHSMRPHLYKFERSPTNDLYNTMAVAAVLGALEFVLFVITLVVVSMYIHRERVGGAGAESADPTSASATQSAAPQSTTRPRDLEQEMIEIENQNQNQNHSNVQHPQQNPTQAEGHDVSQVEHLE